jgi:hypothetical protein
MVSEKISKLCEKVEKLATQLDAITNSGHVRTAYGVVAIMKLSVVTSELVYEDLLERIRESMHVATPISRP